jgi:meso-butanediol dehydrogenase/(S,S)-butanediol dehydrogenase/diacetyl reductase
MTQMTDAAFAVAEDSDAARQDALARHPAGRLGNPEDVAATAVWLASAESAFVTGQCFVVDGGMTSTSPVNPGFF